MSVEWDEGLIAGLESGLHNCGSDECQERQRAVRIARAEHTARLEAEALLAQRDGELEALREKVGAAISRSAWAVCPFCGFLNRPYDQKPSADDHKESCPWRLVFAALSDNQGGQDE